MSQCWSNVTAAISVTIWSCLGSLLGSGDSSQPVVPLLLWSPSLMMFLRVLFSLFSPCRNLFHSMASFTTYVLMSWWLTNLFSQVQISCLSFRIIYPTVVCNQYLPSFSISWNTENDGDFMVTYLTETVLCQRDNSREALTSWIVISTWTSPRHFNISTFGSKHISSPKSALSSGVFCCSEWTYYLQVT